MPAPRGGAGVTDGSPLGHSEEPAAEALPAEAAPQSCHLPDQQLRSPAFLTQ